jgi:RNA polymerase sigma-54 factor
MQGDSVDKSVRRIQYETGIAVQYQKPTLVQQQKLKMSPQMYQSLQLMALPIQDLRMKIQEELERNPALELINDGTEVSYESLEADRQSEEYDVFENSSDPGYTSSGSVNEEAADNKRRFMEGALTRSESLQDHLLWQLRVQPIPDTLFRAAEKLIHNLDENGFHIVEPSSLMTQKEARRLNEALELVRQFDPPGVAVRNFRESLLVQAELSPEAPPHTEELLEHHFDLLEKQDLKAIARTLKIGEEQARGILDFIHTLTPYPGRLFSNDSTTYVIPDVLVRRKEGQFRIILNDDEIPVLRVNPDYEEMDTGDSGMEDRETRRFIKQSVRDARWLIRSVEQRNQNLVKIAYVIAEFQHKFFLYGPKHLAPLTLKDVAEEVGVHETTVSRIVNAKYIQTEWGIFPLKYFFSNAITGTGSGGSRYSKEAVKEIIRELIEEQSVQSGRLSDQKISDMLKKRGISIARRTVSKYRKELDIRSPYRS